MFKMFKLLYILYILGTVVKSEERQPIVSTPLGIIEGTVGYTVFKKPFFRFDGIPYAKPPVGDLRYEDPKDPEPWIGILKANILTRCMQYDHYTVDNDNNYVVHGDEDCLHLNIYTHTLDPNANLDVLFSIHGGAFMFGRAASYGPEILMERNIVFVNINYRLGALGFLSTEDDILPGNLGLKDQIKALQWVKENIQLFGGNPNSVTLHGLSAGGASVHLHYLMPQSKGLFKQGISQSGVAINPWVLVENAKEKTKKVADLVGCPTDTSKAIVECLKSKSAKQIVQTTKWFQPFLYNPFSPFGVTVDGLWSKHPVLPDHPYVLMKKGKVQDLPWIVSYVAKEGLYPAADFYANEEYLEGLDKNWNKFIPFICHYNDSLNPEFMDTVSSKIRKQYLGDKPLNKATYSSLVKLIGDRLFLVDLETAAKLQSSVMKSDVYSYFFDYKAAVSKTNSRTKSKVYLGTAHGDDTIFAFKTELDSVSTDQDRMMSKFFVDMIISFMKTGKPNVTSEWVPVEKSVAKPYQILKITGPKNYKMLYEKEIGQRSFWESLPLREYFNMYRDKEPNKISDEL